MTTHRCKILSGITVIPQRGASTASVAVTRGYPELCRLPKAPVVRSIRFKRTSPGIPAGLLLAPTSTPLVDPSHPLASLPPRQIFRIVPQFRCTLFSAHAYPNAVLNRFEDVALFKQLKGKGISTELNDALDQQLQNKIGTQFPQVPQEHNNRVQTMVSRSTGDRRRARHTLPMSLVLVTPKKTLHKSAVIRSKVKLRLKEAISLVVIRGAEQASKGDPISVNGNIAFKTPEGISRESPVTNALLENWTYIMRPSLEIYRCPWPSLVTYVRDALVQLKAQAEELEEKWSARSRNVREKRRGSDRESMPQVGEHPRQRRVYDSSSHPGLRVRAPTALQSEPATRGSVGRPSTTPPFRHTSRDGERSQNPSFRTETVRSGNYTQSNSHNTSQRRTGPAAHPRPNSLPDASARETNRSSPRAGRLYKSPIVLNPQTPGNAGNYRRGGKGSGPDGGSDEKP